MLGLPQYRQGHRVSTLCVLIVCLFLGGLACEWRPTPGVSAQRTGVVTQSIIGGQPDRQMPAVGGLTGGTQSSFCTGTLVATKVVLTAAHCIDSARQKANLQFRVEVADSSPQGFSFHYYPADASLLTTHPNWTRDANKGFDVGFVILSKAVIAAHATPMPYNIAPIEQSWVGKTPLFLGYGLIQTTPQVVRATVKYGVNIPITIVQSDRIITKGNGKSVCHGDSGGPALAQFAGVWKVFAVNSYVTGPQISSTLSACRGTGASDRTDTYKTYIQSIMQTHGDGGCTQDSQCMPNERCVQGKCGPPPPDPCGNGTCDAAGGENCTSCAVDCGCPANQECKVGACVAKSTCGDGTCDAAGGENCTSCAQDCACPANQECQNNTCQAKANPCGDGTCDAAGGENCTTCAVDCGCPANQTCQNGQCAAPIGSCGDGTCDTAGGETCTTCAQDCLCPSDQTCQNGQCVTGTTPPGGCTQNAECASDQTCQNGQCVAGTTPPPGSCIQDTDCPAGQTCANGTCQAGTAPPPSNSGNAGGPCLENGLCAEGLLCFVDTKQTRLCFPDSTPPSAFLCPHYFHTKSCDATGQNCKFYCLKPQGSGCNIASQPNPTRQLWLLLFLLPLLRRRTRS